MIDFYASRQHYLDHLAPVWHALPERARGSFNVGRSLVELARYYGIEPDDRTEGRMLVCAAWSDHQGPAQGRRRVLLEHGIGQNYLGRWSNYVGGAGREKIDLFLYPNQRARDINAARYPGAGHAVIGCPKLDRWWGSRPGNRQVISFHWECQLVNETTSGWRYFWPAVRRPWWGHAHPRIARQLAGRYADAGVPYLPDFATVLRAGGLYACDNSSTLYEFAALGRPVIVLNPPQYRRNVEHGLRFWEYADVGVNCDHPDQLEACAELAWSDPPQYAERRAQICEELFPYRGTASVRAASVLEASL